MRQALHAFGDHLASKGVRQVNHAAQNGQVIRVVQHVGDKALVNFEQRDRQALQVSQRRIAGTKVVQGKTHAELATRFNDIGHAVQIFKRAGFQHLHLQLTGLDAGVSRQNLTHAVDKTRLLDLPGTDVDADRNRQPKDMPK